MQILLEFGFNPLWVWLRSYAGYVLFVGYYNASHPSMFPFLPFIIKLFITVSPLRGAGSLTIYYLLCIYITIYK